MGTPPKHLSTRHKTFVFGRGSACDYFAAETGGVEEVEEGGVGEFVGGGGERGEECVVFSECGELCFGYSRASLDVI